MKACHIGLRWSSKVSGGAERIFSELAAGLPEAGVRFLGAVAGSPDLNLQTQGLVHSFAPETSGTLTRLRGSRRLLSRLLSEEKPDLLASHFALYTLPVLDRLRERPFVMHFHGPWAMESGIEGGSASEVFAKKKIEQIVYTRADRVITLSKAFAALLQNNYGIAPAKIRLVPGAVDLDRYSISRTREQAREQLGWPNDRPILLTVRRLVHRMGLQPLLEALPAIRNVVPDVLLFLAGTGPLRPDLERFVQERKLALNVRFLGFLPEEHLPLAYRAADLTVVPTLALEGFGLVAAESLAAGTPAMVTRVGGLPEVVEGLSEGLLFRSGSSADIAAGLIDALRSRSAVPTASECRAYAEAKFSRRLMVTRVADVYKEL